MTPKEKAEELTLRYFQAAFGLSVHESKQCALIAVDEIIASNPCYEDEDRGRNFIWSDNTYYWQEVKQEIEML